MNISASSQMEQLPVAAPPGFGPCQVFATSPQSLDGRSETYCNSVVEVARWSEAAGCTGSLIYTDNSIVDPWLVAQSVLAHTRTLTPLVAVQPLYMHPYAAAKMVASLGFLYGRRVILNMVAGGFKNDLLSLGDTTPHDRRYDRLVEYVNVVKKLLGSTGPVTWEGEFYQLKQAVLKPGLPAPLQPGFFISGSSEAGMAAAAATGAVPIQYPGPPEESVRPAQNPGTTAAGVRLGIIARPTTEEAWEVAHQRFPFDRKGQIAHQMAMRVSDSQWHHQLSGLSGEVTLGDGTYWLGPFEISKSNCPYLVGSYAAVTDDLHRYMQLGYRTFILDIPPSAEELAHSRIVFAEAAARLPQERQAS